MEDPEASEMDVDVLEVNTRQSETFDFKLYSVKLSNASPLPVHSVSALVVYLHRTLSGLGLTYQYSDYTDYVVINRESGATWSMENLCHQIFSAIPPTATTADQNLEMILLDIWQDFSSKTYRYQSYLDVDVSHIDGIFKMLSDLLGLKKYFYGTRLPKGLDLKFLSIILFLHYNHPTSAMYHSLRTFVNLRARLDKILNNFLRVQGPPKCFKGDVLWRLLNEQEEIKPITASFVRRLVLKNAIDELPVGSYYVKGIQATSNTGVNLNNEAKFEIEVKALHELSGLANVVKLLGISVSEDDVPVNRRDDVPVNTLIESTDRINFSDALSQVSKSNTFPGSEPLSFAKHDQLSTVSTSSSSATLSKWKLLILEDLTHGDLESRREKFDWPSLVSIAEEMAYGLFIISTAHEKYKIHGDLKLQNICLNKGMRPVYIDLATYSIDPSPKNAWSWAFAERDVPEFDRWSDIYALSMCYLRLCTSTPIIYHGENYVPPQDIVFEKIRLEGLDEALALHLRGGWGCCPRDDLFADIIERIYEEGYDSADGLFLRYGNRSMQQKFVEIIAGMCSKRRPSRLPLDRVVGLLRRLINFS